MNYQDFLEKQELLSISTCFENESWIANVYFAKDDLENLFFISSLDTKHSEMILKNSNISFSTAWFDQKNHKNRKSIQGYGKCVLINTPIELAKGIKLLYSKFDDLRDVLTVEWLINNVWKTKLWKIEPKYLKYWNDELYKDDEFEEFYIN